MLSHIQPIGFINLTTLTKYELYYLVLDFKFRFFVQDSINLLMQTIYLLLRLHFRAARIRADLFFIYETEISTTFALGAFAPRASRRAHSLHAPNFYETDP